MQLPRPSALIAELSYRCPLHCPYCSNPLDIGHEKYRGELETEHWIRTFREARGLGVLQLALTGGEPMLRRDLVELCAGSRDAGLYSSLITAGVHFTRERAEEAGQRFRERVGPKVDVLWVLPDFYEDLPKPCMGGWGRTAVVVAPNGDVLPCQAASTIPGLEFANVREHPLEWIWSESDAFARFRGTDWMQEPCRSCPLGRQEVDWGGCRCQALRLTGDAAATDPVCRFSQHHDRVVAARESAQTNEFVYRTMKRPRVPY